MGNKQQFQKVAGFLKNLAENQRRKKKISFAIVYTAPYALYAHENLEAKHENGQAKFLEKVMKERAKEITPRVKQLMQQGRTLRQALLEVANWILEESKKLVPVDTGTLRDSGTVKIV